MLEFLYSYWPFVCHLLSTGRFVGLFFDGVVSLLNLLSFMYILDINPLSNVYLTKIFSHPIVFSLHLYNEVPFVSYWLYCQSSLSPLEIPCLYLDLKYLDPLLFSSNHFRVSVLIMLKSLVLLEMIFVCVHVGERYGSTFILL